MRTNRLSKQPGNALMEYAVPMAAILITCGVLGTVLDINGIMKGFFAAASGHTSSDIAPDGTLQTTTNPMQSGQARTGASGFQEYGTMTDGAGNPITTGTIGEVNDPADPDKMPVIPSEEAESLEGTSPSGLGRMPGTTDTTGTMGRQAENPPELPDPQLPTDDNPDETESTGASNPGAPG